jgi:hypothetical protein
MTSPIEDQSIIKIKQEVKQDFKQINKKFPSNITPIVLQISMHLSEVKGIC